MKGNRFLYLTVFTVGISTLGAEIAAARLLAPFFGASTIVWANTIGVVLVALSLGYWYGGKLGDRYPELTKLCQVVIGGAVLLTLIPFIAQPFFEVAISALDEIEAGAFVGSLFAVLFLVAIPLAVLGTVSPWAIRLSVDEVEHAGAVAGRLYAISTVGSLLGTMISALVLIPFAGTQRTFIVFGVMLALVGALGLPRRYLLAPALIAATLAIPVGAIKSTEDGEVIYEKDSEHQYIRVVEEADGDRLLELNEGQAVHSLLRADSTLTDDVWDGYLVLPFAGLDGPPERIAILGNAAGTTARSYGEYLPETGIDGVEIDPELEEVGNKYFDMDSNENLDGPLRGRAPMAPALRGRLRRDLRRRLPPALHPVLPRDEGVLRARPRAPRAGRSGRRERRPPRGERRPREGPGPNDVRGLPERHARSDRADEHAAGRRARASSPPTRSARALRTCRSRSRTSARPRRRASASSSRAARSTPTTARPSSG